MTGVGVCPLHFGLSEVCEFNHGLLIDYTEMDESVGAALGRRFCNETISLKLFPNSFKMFTFSCDDKVGHDSSQLWSFWSLLWKAAPPDVEHQEEWSQEEKPQDEGSRRCSLDNGAAGMMTGDVIFWRSCSSEMRSWVQSGDHLSSRG